VPDEGSPTVRRRRLAAELHRLRDRVGLTGDQVAERLGWSPSKVSRIENTRSGIKVSDAQRLLDLYGVAGAHREELVALAREAERKGWWDAYSGALPGEYAALIGLEAEAELAWNWEPQIVPGLLQTEEYARAVIRAHMGATATVPPGEIERRVAARMARQEVLTRAQPLQLTVALDESVLLRRFGDDSVMGGQLARLAQVSELPNVKLRVLPLAGSHPIGTGGFVLLQFNQVHKTALRDVVYLENLSGSLYVEDEAETYQYRLAFGRLVEDCLDSARSRELVSRVAREIQS